MVSRQIILTSQDNIPDNPWESSKTPPGGARPGPSSADGKYRYKPKNGGGGKGSGNPPPLPPFLDEFRNLFGQDTSPGKTFMILAAILLFMWLASGLYRVQPEENAVILRLGKFTETVSDAGLHYHLPWPFETALKENVTFERRIEVGYRGTSYGGSEKQDIPEESMMLTGDANIVDLDFVVQWKVADAKQFMFNIREPEATLKRAAESAMREVIGQNDLQDIITDRREDIAARAKTIMQDIINSYGAGIMITQVLLQDSSVPEPVKNAYLEVKSASQEAETMRNEALKYRNEIVPRAQGESIRLMKDAEAYKQQIVSKAQGEVERFLSVYEAYSQAKDVTRSRLYIDAWEQILRNNNVIIMENGGKNGAVPYINLNELHNKKEEAGDVSSMETIR